VRAGPQEPTQQVFIGENFAVYPLKMRVPGGRRSFMSSATPLGTSRGGCEVRRRTMAREFSDAVLVAPQQITFVPEQFGAARAYLGLLLGPVAACLLWMAPLELEPVQHKTIAVVVFMIVYWLTEPIEHGLTALIGCYLFWALDIVKFSVAFSGFANSTVWFLFGSLLLADAAARTGFAKRLGCLLLRRTGSSYGQLIFGLSSLTYLLALFVPTGLGRLSILAPLTVGIVKASGADERSNLSRGLFVLVTSLAFLSDVMILSGVTSMMTRGIVEEQTGIQLLWSQWFLAFLPLSVATILLSVPVIRWLYPAAADHSLLGKDYFQKTLDQMGPWSSAEKKSLAWFLLAVVLWATDSVHHFSPAMVGLGVAMLVCMPKIGILDAKAIKQVNFLLILFCAGAISMGNVLIASNTLPLLTDRMIGWMQPLIADTFSYATILITGGFLYQLIFANRQAMLITSLPILLSFGSAHGYNLVALSLLWTFGGGGGLFIYQSGVYVLGYSYGSFEAKDFFKFGAVMTILEGLLLVLVVQFYWPSIGLNWIK
jgi:sodium-dependent dicarboxylate transporter 2/3/5